MTFLDDDAVIAMAKRALAPPGQFATTWPGATDDDIVGMMADGFGSARLAGFFSTHEYDANTNQVTPDLTDAGLSLVVAYMAMNSLQSKVMTMATGRSYKAGPVEATTTPLASVLTALLEQAADRIRILRNGQGVTPQWSDSTFTALGPDYLSSVELRRRPPIC